MSEIALSPLELERYFRSANYETSAAKLSQCPEDTGCEVAFAGRSNAGKSSAINRITDNKKLAKTSKTPGRTQLINFFTLKDGCRLVDLPGYGFAKVSRNKKLEWQKLMEDYLQHRKSLKALILLVDSRHPLQPVDEIMLQWALQYEMPCQILLTKADKLSKNQGQKAQLSIQKSIKKSPLISIQLFSAINGFGLNKAQNALYDWLKDTEKCN